MALWAPPNGSRLSCGRLARRPPRRREPQRGSVTYQLITNCYLSSELFRLRDGQVTADLAGEELVDVTMPRDRGCLARRSIHIHGVVGAFPQEVAAVGLEMANEVTPLQGGVILKRSRMTDRVPRAS